MKRRPFLITLGSFLTTFRLVLAEGSMPIFKVTLGEAHKGTPEIDARLLDSYGRPAHNLRQFYMDARKLFQADAQAAFTDPAIIAAAEKYGLALMGGPLLGDLRDDGVKVWMRPATERSMTITVADQSFPVKSLPAGTAVRTRLDGLAPSTRYAYEVKAEGEIVAQGKFTSAPRDEDQYEFRITFGSCCHKIGLHNPNLFREILRRNPNAMLFLGDIAVDDRNNQINMHRADYQLRDVSEPWRDLVSKVPVYASWDDHDYFDNDLSGIPRRFDTHDRDKVRAVWQENWNNPAVDNQHEGIYFNARVGPVEVIMLDTRSCRDNQRRHQYGSYLGRPQLDWLKDTLKTSTAPFKVISSGTMWSDYVSKGKDSWGSWDVEAREEIFNLIEQDKIGGVLLVSGDRHGARGFRIPRPSGFAFYEFEPACLGGVSGPAGLVRDCPEQLFGYSGTDEQGNDFVAFGEFTFNTSSEEPAVTFRLISQFGETLEEMVLRLSTLTPGESNRSSD